MRPRDSQRSRVYAWERVACRRFLGRPIHDPEFESLGECAQYLEKIWMAERGRYGRANILPPAIERPNRGQRRAIAHEGDRIILNQQGKRQRSAGRITLPKWARSRWLILHEAAHRLTPKDEAHGPRFVAVLMGMLARHLDLDINELMQSADNMGVSYRVGSIGACPVHGLAWKVRRALRENGRMTEIELAVECDVSYRQIRGALLSLRKSGEIKLTRSGVISLVQPEPSIDH